jgi:dihydroorotate dehydrogenase
LRELQQAEQLDGLLRALQALNKKLGAEDSGHGALPILVKLSPDLNSDELTNIVEVAQRNDISGLIATNTTTGRAGLRTPTEKVAAYGAGGLSGAPLKRMSAQIIARLYNLTGGSMPLIGVGGIFTAEDAWEMISAGASLVQVYTGLIYEGPSIARDINEGLRRIISSAGFVSFDEAVGSRALELAR